MTSNAQQILESALNLPTRDRAFLAEKLLESLDTDADFVISDAWKTEINRRCAQIDKGEVELISDDEVFKQAFEALG